MNALLLRLLLIVTLVLNGPGLAMASSMTMTAGMDMRSDVMQSSTPAMHAMPVASAKPPCHGGDADAAVSAVEHQPLAVADTHTDRHANPAPDCCHAGSCQCACAHATPWALSALRLPVAAGGTAVAQTDASAHAEPAPPQLIRPPIV